jgi:tetratricopeptide (TPR) repeat protein
MKKTILIFISILLNINIYAQQELFMAQGSSLIENGEFDKAVEVLTQSIEEQENPEWFPYFLRSIAYANLQKITFALDDTEKALQKIKSDKKQNDAIYKIYEVRAEIFKMTENYEKSLKEVSAAIKFSPNEKVTQKLIKARAYYYFLNSNYAASIKDYQKILKQNPQDSQIKLSIVRSIVNEQEENFVSYKKINVSALKKALGIVDEIISAEADYKSAYKFRMRANVLMKNYADAIRDAYMFRSGYDAIVAELSGDSEVRYAEELFFNCTDLDSLAAPKILEEEIAKTPQNPLPCYLFALFYEGLNDHKKAIDFITQAINKTDRELNELLIKRAKFFYSNEDYDSALNDLHIAKQHNDSNAYIFYLAGTFYQKIENWDEAAKNFSECIRLKPDVAEGYAMRASVYQKQKKFALAQADLDSLIKMDETNIEVLYSYAYFYMEKGDRKQSNEVYKKILNIIDSIYREDELNPKYLAGIYNNMSYNCIKIGEYQQAGEYVDKALKMNEESSHIWDTRGELYFCLKKYQECIDDMNRAIELSENENKRESANSYFYRGRARLELGLTAEGNADIQKAAALEHNEAIEWLKGEK